MLDEVNRITFGFDRGWLIRMADHPKYKNIFSNLFLFCSYVCFSSGITHYDYMSVIHLNGKKSQFGSRRIYMRRTECFGWPKTCRSMAAVCMIGTPCVSVRSAARNVETCGRPVDWFRQRHRGNRLPFANPSKGIMRYIKQSQGNVCNFTESQS